MKRAENKFQRSYMVAKACVEEIEFQRAEIEKKYIANNGIVNPDGSVPKFLSCMDSDAAFEKVNEECGVLIIAAGLGEEYSSIAQKCNTKAGYIDLSLAQYLDEAKHRFGYAAFELD